MQKRESETQTEFAIRAIKAETWSQAHAELCDFGGAQCAHHPNPHEGDE